MPALRAAVNRREWLIQEQVPQFGRHWPVGGAIASPLGQPSTYTTRVMAPTAWGPLSFRRFVDFVRLGLGGPDGFEIAADRLAMAKWNGLAVENGLGDFAVLVVRGAVIALGLLLPFR